MLQALLSWPANTDRAGSWWVTPGIVRYCCERATQTQLCS